MVVIEWLAESKTPYRVSINKHVLWSAESASSEDVLEISFDTKSGAIVSKSLRLGESEIAASRTLSMVVRKLAEDLSRGDLELCLD